MIPTFNPSGQVRYYNFGFGNQRYRRSDFVNMCNTTTFTYFFKPQASMTFKSTTGVPKADEELEVSAPSVEGIDVYPNPFSTSTTFSFTLATAGKATLEIYNIAGARVATAFEGVIEANSNYNVVYEPEDLPNGIYFYSLNVGDKTYRGKITLAK